MNNIEKWKKAIIHLECAVDSKDPDESFEKFIEIAKLHREKKIDDTEYMKLIKENSLTRDLRFQGTAIFFQKNGKRYLLTARHVIWDQVSADREYKKLQADYQKNPSRYSEDILKYEIGHIERHIYHIIFRVPSIDESKEERTYEGKNFLMNLGAGRGPSYTFSPPDIDLAVISLDSRGSHDSQFADNLISKGYVPIDTDDIEQGNLREGDEVMAVGFPAATALAREISLTSGLDVWSSRFYSVPIFSFGRIAMANENIDFLWTDLSIYPGNSGGPVISNNKLIGIVSAQATIPVEGSTTKMETRIPFGKIIKSKHIVDLIEEQDKKDNEIPEYKIKK